MKRFNTTLRIGLLSLAAIAVCGTAAAQQKLQKSVSWENIRAHQAPLPVIGELAAPPHSSFDVESRWSVGCECLDRDMADFELFKEFMGETGVGYSRLQSGWAKTEKKKGKYDFKWLDAHVDGLIEQGIHPWMCLCYGNPLYSDHGMTLNAKLFPDGPVMDAWLKYVRACVTRYKGKISMYEVWNEPDGGGNSKSYDLYANMFDRTAAIIREVDPDVKIAAFGVCWPNWTYVKNVLEYLKQKDHLSYVDYVTYHAYRAIPELSINQVRQFRKNVASISPSITIMQGETGCPAQLEYGHALNNIEWTECSQAKWDLRQSLGHFGNGVPYSFFTMVDLNYGWMLQSFGLVRLNGEKKPVYKRPKFYAVQHVTSLFTPDMATAEGVEVAGPLNSQITSFGLQKGGKKVGCMMWMGGRRPTPSLDRLCADVSIQGVAFKDPVYVDMLTGYVHELKGVTISKDGSNIFFKDFPLWDSPVVVIERSAVPLKEK